jgi:hypothetical protein
MIFELPSPDTGYGYTEEFLKTFLTDWQYFTKNWMNGKTYAVIDGKRIYYVHNVINYIRQVHKKEPVFTAVQKTPKETFDIDEIKERICEAVDTMDGDEIAELCNREFGMTIQYDGDSIFSQKEEVEKMQDGQAPVGWDKIET